jgi:hypothetical protein
VGTLFSLLCIVNFRYTLPRLTLITGGLFMAKPNFRMGRRGAPPGRINTYRGQVKQWKGHGPSGPIIPPPPPSFRILGAGSTYITSADGVYINHKVT